MPTALIASMSKKNNKGAKRRAHAHELEREKAEKEKKQQQQEKKLTNQATSGGIAKTKAKKAFRIRKGVQIKGIKVVDSDTKKKVRQLLKAEAAMKMDVDDGKPKKRGKVLLKGAVLKKKQKKLKVASAVAAENDDKMVI